MDSNLEPESQVPADHLASKGDEDDSPTRPMPDLGFLRSVIRRNFLPVLLIVSIFAPMVAYVLKTAESKYPSTIFLYYSYADLFDFDGRNDRAKFPIIVAFMQEKLKDFEFLREIARRAELPHSPSFIERLPKSLQHTLNKYVTPRSIESDLTAAAIRMTTDLILTVDGYTYTTVTIARIEATESSREAAQRLVSAAAESLVESYYAEELKKAESKKAYFTSMLENPSVKTVSGGPASGRSSGAAAGSDAATAQNDAARRRRALAKIKLRELSLELDTVRSYRVKMESEVAELAERYGPFHPKVIGLQRILEASKKNSRESALTNQIYQSSEEAFEVTESGESVEKDTPETAVTSLGTQLKFLELKQQALELQIRDPKQRQQLIVLGNPTVPAFPTSSAKKSKAILLAAICGALCFVVVVLGEILPKRIRDPWPAAFRLQASIISVMPGAVMRKSPHLKLTDIREQILELATRPTSRHSSRALASIPVLHYRQIDHWLHSKSKGRIVLWLKASAQPKSKDFIANLANVCAVNYSGHVLVIDLDSEDAMVGADHTVAAKPSILDLVLRGRKWGDICQPRGEHRAYDLVCAPPSADFRLGKVLSTASFSNFFRTLPRKYTQIFVVGLGPDQFIENGLLADLASDVMILVEAGQPLHPRMVKQVTKLNRGKIGGIVYLEQS
jgi:hypothetical protein